jgi:hypothetical protein
MAIGMSMRMIYIFIVDLSRHKKYKAMKIKAKQNGF